MNIGFVRTLPIFGGQRNRELARYFGRQLRELRLDYGLSRDGLARKTGFSWTTIRSYEQGKSMPCFRFLVALQQVFDIDINLFIPPENIPPLLPELNDDWRFLPLDEMERLTR